MKTRYKYIHFEKNLFSSEVWNCINNNTNHRLGILEYYPEWKQYIFERHRHRYELNNIFREALESKGMIVAGKNPEKDLVEIIELPKHPFFVATQFHPEFKSRPIKSHPLFKEFMRTAIKNR